MLESYDGPNSSPPNTVRSLHKKRSIKKIKALNGWLRLHKGLTHRVGASGTYDRSPHDACRTPGT